MAALQDIFPIIALAPSVHIVPPSALADDGQIVSLSSGSTMRTVWRTINGPSGGLIVRAKALKKLRCGRFGRCGRKNPDWLNAHFNMLL